MKQQITPLTTPKINIACVSDIHLGHRRNKAANITKNLREAFPDNAETASLDIIFLAGDVFDSLLSLPNPDVWDIKLWIKDFLTLCKKHDIAVRVLEGTPKHDRNQSTIFQNTNVLANIGADLLYVKNLSIVYEERYGISVLFVPDEWGPTEKTLSQVKQLIRAKGLQQVDYAIMHGQFEHQLPSVAKDIPIHNAKEYLSLVKHFIFIGHVHIFSLYDRIVAQGSFDRISHGEEGPKGHVRLFMESNGVYQLKFVENINAMKYLTISCIGLTPEESLKTIAAKIVDLPSGSHVRIEIEKSNALSGNIEELIRQYPLFNWSKKDAKNKEIEANKVEEDIPFVPIALTKDNLPGMLMDSMFASGVNSLLIEEANKILIGVINSP